MLKCYKYFTMSGTRNDTPVTTKSNTRTNSEVVLTRTNCSIKFVTMYCTEFCQIISFRRWPLPHNTRWCRLFAKFFDCTALKDLNLVYNTGLNNESPEMWRCGGTHPMHQGAGFLLITRGRERFCRTISLTDVLNFFYPIRFHKYSTHRQEEKL
jgi:hypothetical protein